MGEVLSFDWEIERCCDKLDTPRNLLFIPTAFVPLDRLTQKCTAELIAFALNASSWNLDIGGGRSTGASSECTIETWMRFSQRNGA
jgi:hypothetical protein